MDETISAITRITRAKQLPCDDCAPHVSESSGHLEMILIGSSNKSNVEYSGVTVVGLVDGDRVTGSVVTNSVVASSVMAGSVVADSVEVDSVVAGSIVTMSVVVGSVVTRSVVTGSVDTGIFGSIGAPSHLLISEWYVLYHRRFCSTNSYDFSNDSLILDGNPYAFFILFN